MHLELERPNIDIKTGHLERGMHCLRLGAPEPP